MEEPSRDGGASRSPVPPASQAERARMASSLAEDLVCPVCLAIFREPHLLGCGHNFCLSCLQGCVPKGQGAGTCPECRLPFQLRELKPNRALASLSSKARRLRLDEGPAVHFCEEHDEPLKLFCCQESAPICVICRDLPQHRGHDFLPTQNAVKYAQVRWPRTKTHNVCAWAGRLFHLYRFYLRRGPEGRLLSRELGFLCLDPGSDLHFNCVSEDKMVQCKLSWAPHKREKVSYKCNVIIIF
uniref:Uncharacterized protein n=1 Tax=Varanus komodoensis TaxID=61221 RepID=A0A8D2J5Q2_VARKO